MRNGFENKSSFNCTHFKQIKSPLNNRAKTNSSSLRQAYHTARWGGNCLSNNIETLHRGRESMMSSSNTRKSIDINPINIVHQQNSPKSASNIVLEDDGTDRKE